MDEETKKIAMKAAGDAFMKEWTECLKAFASMNEKERREYILKILAPKSSPYCLAMKPEDIENAEVKEPNSLKEKWNGPGLPTKE